MVKRVSFKRLILRAVLRQVSPMLIRLVSVSDQMPLHEFHDVFRTILGWNGDLGYIVRVHGQELIASGGRRGPKHCTSSSCTGRKNSSTSATPCICVVSKRFVKKQQMQWTLRGAHLLLQTRTRVLNEDLDDLFRRWYPKFRPQPPTQDPERKAA